MTSRIIITPQDIIARFKPCDPPADFEALFGPIGVREQNHPFKYDSFKLQKIRKTPGPVLRGHQQQQPLPSRENSRQQQNEKTEANIAQNKQNKAHEQENDSKFKPYASTPSQNQENITSFTSVISNQTAPEIQQQVNQPQQFAPQQAAQIFQPIIPPISNQFQTQNIPPPFFQPQPIEAQQPQFTQMGQFQPQQFPQQAFPNQFYPQIFPQNIQQVPFGQPQNIQVQAAPMFQPQVVTGFHPVPAQQPQPQIVSFESILKDQQQQSIAEQQQVQQQQPVQFVSPQAQETVIPQQIEQPQEKTTYVRKPRGPQHHVETIKEIEAKQQKEEEQKSLENTANNNKQEQKQSEVISYDQVLPSQQPPIKFSEVEKETKKQTEKETKEQAKKNKQKQEEEKKQTPTYVVPKPTAVPAKVEEFISIQEREQINKAIEESLREQYAEKKKPQPVISYQTAATVNKNSNVPSMEDIFAAEANSNPQANRQKERAKRGTGKFTPYVAPKKEPVLAPIQPNVPSFDELLSQQEKTKEKQQLQVVDKQKKGKAKYTPYVEPKPANPYASVAPATTSSTNTSFSALLSKEEKNNTSTKQQTQKVESKPAETKKGKKKFVPFEEVVQPKTNPYANVTSTTSNKGPSFDDLMASEAKSKPAASTSEKKSKKGKKMVISENLGTYQIKKFDLDEAEEKHATKRRTTTSNSNSPMFAQLMAEEERKQPKQNANNPVNSYRPSPQMHSTKGPSFNDLFRAEQQRESFLEASPILAMGEEDSKPVFSQKSQKKQNKKKQSTNDDNLFWGGGNDSDDDVNEILPQRDFPALTKPAPSQKSRSANLQQNVNRRIEEMRKNAPIDWLTNQLVEHGYNREEAAEVASVIATQPRDQMTSSIRSLVNDQIQANYIVSQFFKKFPKGK